MQLRSRFYTSKKIQAQKIWQLLAINESLWVKVIPFILSQILLIIVFFLCSCDCWKQTSIYFGEIHTVRQMSFQQHLYVLSSGKEDMNCFNQNFVDNHYKNDDIFQILSSLIYDKKIQKYEILFRWTFHFPRSITRTTNVVRNAGCARSRYTLKIFLMN